MTNPLIETDRRRTLKIRDILVPVFTATIVGVCSSMLATYVTINVLQLKVEYIERDLNKMLSIVESMNKNEMRLDRVEVWIINAEKRFDKYEQRIENNHD